MATRRWSQRFPREVDNGETYTIYYTIDRSLNFNRRRIEEAMEEIESHSRIIFEPRRQQRCFLKITKDNGCWFQGLNECRPRISLGMGCSEYGTILHELLHAIGFPHEHNRPDRSNYIVINWRNIKYEIGIAPISSYQKYLAVSGRSETTLLLGSGSVLAHESLLGTGNLTHDSYKEKAAAR
ncbi:hypothetical protein AVEN_89591-1 [Araneus ventricosus]|uniref:Metalloendopeptidase n=1 Tax=Araneus ventricosus TaxID=182803 RepID=A0A4Y2IK18_ARAVE|nr:hypothetical protein AVEN_89591-1 [Araneus ventricosus]